MSAVPNVDSAALPRQVDGLAALEAELTPAGLAGWLRPECLALGVLFGAGLLWIRPPGGTWGRAAGSW